MVVSCPPVARSELKKPVYDSGLTKRAEGMSFVNAKPSVSLGLGKQDFGGRGEVQLVF